MSEPTLRICIRAGQYLYNYSRWGGQSCHQELLTGPAAFFEFLSKACFADSTRWKPLPPFDPNELGTTGVANLDGGYLVGDNPKTLLFFSYGMTESECATIISSWHDYRAYRPNGNELAFFDALDVEWRLARRACGSDK